jgi:hypothetical protein
MIVAIRLSGVMVFEGPESELLVDEECEDVDQGQRSAESLLFLVVFYSSFDSCSHCQRTKMTVENFAMFRDYPSGRFIYQ